MEDWPTTRSIWHWLGIAKCSLFHPCERQSLRDNSMARQKHPAKHERIGGEFFYRIQSLSLRTLSSPKHCTSSWALHALFHVRHPSKVHACSCYTATVRQASRASRPFSNTSPGGRSKSLAGTGGISFNFCHTASTNRAPRCAKPPPRLS